MNGKSRIILDTIISNRDFCDSIQHKEHIELSLIYLF